jgi:hypothetical protein
MDAKSGVTAAEARTFADQSVAAFADVVKFGWAIPSERKELDRDAVRRHPDFQKLFAEVAAKAEKPPETALPLREKKWATAHPAAREFSPGRKPA